MIAARRRDTVPRAGLRALLLVGCALLAALAPVHALDRDLALAQFQHASWQGKDGAPPSTWQLEETVDGWLWLGGARGLYRFDGLQFERFEPPSGPPFATVGISHLRAAANGDLWVGFLGGGLSRIRGAEVTQYGSADGLPADSVRGIMVDLDGTVWAMTPSALLRFDGTRWARVDASWGVATSDAGSIGLLVDGKGTLWFSDTRSTWVLRRGEHRFERLPVHLQGDSWQSVDGRLWVISGRRMTPAPEVDAAAKVTDNPWVGRRHSSTLVDRQGNLWSSFCAAGICRSRLPEPLAGAGFDLPAVEERFDRRDGLSGDMASHIVEDRAGSLWVATQAGLDRFRRGVVVPVATPDGFARHLLPEADGSVTVLGAGSATYREPRRWRADRQAEPQAETVVAQAVHRDRQGRTWLASEAGLSLAGRADSLRPWPDDASRARGVSMASDGRGLWIAATGGPLLRYEHDAGRFVAPAEPELRRDRPRAVAADGDGRAWFGFGDGHVVSLRDGELHRYGSAEGLDIGAIAYLYAGGSVFAAGERGVAILRAGRFHRVVADDAEALASVTGIVETADGAVWFNGLKGIVRVSASELDRQAAEPDHPLRYRLLDQLDGLSGSARQGNSTAAVGADGRLWFIGGPGNVVWLDPRRLDDAAPAPTPAVRSLEIAGTLFRPGRAVALAPLTRAVDLRYTALGAAIPERVGFRYRLRGLETAWTEAGHRREVSYANLGPGDYVFEVLAGNGDGAWAAAPATLAFSIRPAFFQTVVFQAACVLGAMLLLALLVLLRVRQVEARARRQMQVRMDERERIARELHDTLLQGVTGLTLHVRAAVNQVAADSPARQRLEHALARATEVMVEGRNRIVALRRADVGAGDLAERLRAEAAALARDRGGPVPTVAIEGTARSLHAAAADEVYWIAREAMANALHHARAGRVALRLGYGSGSLLLEVSDDGIGFDAAVPGPPGHFGRVGLKERAGRLEARLEVRSGAGGTVVTLEVPAARIYASATGGA